MNISKYVLIACVAFAALANFPAQAEPSHGFSTMYVFGDSLSDPGNAFAVTGQTANPPFEPIPSAAYGVGGHHFSNGRTWIEIVAQKMELNESAKPAFRDPSFGNFAFAGARALTTDVPGFDQQVQAYLNIHGCAAPPDALFVVQFGGNDLREAMRAALGGGNPNAIIGSAVLAVVQNIGILAECGARHFLIANAPNLGAAPAVPTPFKGLVAGMSQGYNDALAGALALAAAYEFPPGVNFYHVDFFGFVTAATMSPGSFGFDNASTPCLSFGVVENAFCENRDGHLFWDAIHPTKVGHQKIAEIALNALP